MANSTKFLLLPTAHCAVLDSDAADRAGAELLIRASYRNHYGANIGKLPACLFVLSGPAGETLAAAVLRPAKGARLFLEHYLDAPIEVTLRRHIGRPVDRGDIIEVGSLAVLNPGYGRVLIQTLTAFLYHRRFDWVAFTAVSTLRNSFHRLGLDPRPLCAADPARLPADDDSDWGCYYASKPLVMYGNVPGGYHHLQNGPEALPLLPPSMVCSIGRKRA